MNRPSIDGHLGRPAAHLGSAAAELDFILNYDIKYRLGHDTDAEDD